MRSHLKFGAVLVLLAACGEGPLDPREFTLEGSWLGRAYPYELALELEQDGDNNVTGGGELRAIEEVLETDTISLNPPNIDTLFIDTVVVNQVAVEAFGDWDYPEFELTLRAVDFADVEYAGRFGSTSPDSVSGTLSGSGFETPLRIVRQVIP